MEEQNVLANRIDTARERTGDFKGCGFITIWYGTCRIRVAEIKKVAPLLVFSHYSDE